MASSGVVFGNYETRTVSIATNLSGKEGYAVSLVTDADKSKVALLEAATAFPFVLVEGKDGSGTATEGTIALSGVVTVKTGGGVTAGDKLTATTGGAWITTVTDKDHYGAVALQTGSSGDIIEVSAERVTVSAT